MIKKIFLLFSILFFITPLFAQNATDLQKYAADALKKGDFVLYFQPICKFNKKKICGAEVLTRWQQGDKLVSPGKFIPLFEESGFITELDKYVFENALKYLKSWQEKGLQIGFLSLNLSAVDLENPELINYLQTLLTKYQINPQYLLIEITETAEMKHKINAKNFLLILQDLGFKIALDDFGEGYSTLENLEYFPYSAIKLSKNQLNNFPGNAPELENTIQELQQFNLPIIAEGIEELQQAKFLKKQKIDLAQGYLYYKPMPAEDFEKLLSKKLPKYCAL